MTILFNTATRAAALRTSFALLSAAGAYGVTTAACSSSEQAAPGDTSDAGGPGAHDATAGLDGSREPEPSPDASAPGAWSGEWTGKATVAGGAFTKKGSFSVGMWLVRDESRVRGFLDSNQTAEGTGQANSPSYYVEGTIDATSNVVLELTERACGAGEPQGLCYPDFTNSRAPRYRAEGKLSSGVLTFGQAKAKPDAPALPDGIAFEPPFDSLVLTPPPPLEATSGSGITGNWLGECDLPRDVIFPLPTPMDGVVDVSIDASGAMTSFKLDGIVMYPGDEPIILGDTFRYDAASQRFWFLQVGTTFGRWLYVGQRVGDTLHVLVYSDALDADAFYKAGETPGALTAPTFTNLEGACTLARKAQ